MYFIYDFLILDLTKIIIKYLGFPNHINPKDYESMCVYFCKNSGIIYL